MTAQSYSSVVRSNVPHYTSTNDSSRIKQASPDEHTIPRPSGGSLRRKSPSPSHRPKTDQEEDVYVITLQTDRAHHNRMTALRDTWFPKRLNKLDAHLTLFHALPGSRLEASIVPVIQGVASRTQQFSISASKPFKLKRGIAIGVSKVAGGDQAKNIHQQLRLPWLKEGYLSEQDRGGLNLHYTIMNKVDDEVAVANAYEKVKGAFEVDEGVVEGLGLWRYIPGGGWKWVRMFEFRRPL